MALPDTLIEYKGRIYPKFQTTGNACRFVQPFALEFCKGKGIDFGYNKKEWILPGAMGVEVEDNFLAEAHKEEFSNSLDFVFSSHALEHLESWVEAIKIFTNVLKPGGVLYLYLPDYSQVYWRPWNNAKHKHIICQEHVVDLLIELGHTTVLKSGLDLNSSYSVIGYKK